VSNNESFIDEVTEEVRRDRLYGLLRRYGWIGAVAVLAIVGGAAWFEWQRAQATSAAQALGDAMLAAVESDDPAAALGAVTATGDAEALRLMLIAAEAQRAGDPEAARAALGQAAGLAGIDPLYGDLARLKLLMLADDMDPAERLAGLETLARPGAAYRMPALEQMALVQVAAGDSAAARETLAVILEDAALLPGMRTRAEGLAEALAEPMAGTDGAVAE
jgi:hypothetical protein